MLMVQPVDFRLERAKRDLECAADKTAREDVRLFVVQPAVDNPFLGPTELVICRFTEPTIPPKHQRSSQRKDFDHTSKLGIRTVL